VKSWWRFGLISVPWALADLQLVEQQIGQLDQEIASLIASIKMRSNGWQKSPV
jgi:hypothetical protein